MAINLSKGQKVDLTKGNPGLKKILVGLGWSINEFDGDDFDLDASAFLVNASGKCPTEKEFIFYGNQEHYSHAVKSMGDNKTGGTGDDDDEQILVDLSLVPETIEKIAFTVTIYDAEEKRQNFGQVSNAYIRICDQATGNEIIRYDLGEDFSIETAVVVGELYKNGSEWKFNAIGSGFQGGLAALCAHYGIEVA